MPVNGWKWLHMIKMVGNDLKWHERTRHGWKWVEMAGNAWKWFEMAEKGWR